MKKDTAYRLLLLAAIAVIGTFLLLVYLRHQSYLRTTRIDLIKVQRLPFELELPVVRDTGEKRGKFFLLPVTDRKRLNYSLHWNRESGELYFSILRGEFGGFIIMSCRYRITDPATAERLRQFLHDHAAEFEW